MIKHTYKHGFWLLNLAAAALISSCSAADSPKLGSTDDITNAGEGVVSGADNTSATHPKNPNPGIDISEGGAGGGGGGGAGGGSSSSEVEGLSMSSAISLVTADDTQNNISMSSSYVNYKKVNIPYFSVSSLDSDYTLAKSHFHVNMEALEPLDMANFIMCFIKQLAPSSASTLNQGPYLALVNESGCKNGSESDSGGQTGTSGESQGVQYQSVVVESTRESATADQIIRLWVLGEENKEIRAEAVVKEGVSTSNPFGVFELNWAEVNTNNDVVSGRGTLATSNEDDGVGLRFYTSEQPQSHGQNGPDFDTLFGANARFVQAASAVMQPNSDGNITDGIALTQMKLVNAAGNDIDIIDRLDEVGNITPEEFGVDSFSRSFAISYDSGHMLIQKAPLYAALPFKDPVSPDDSAGTCFSRTDFDQAVWCYELFDAESGDALDLNPGFAFSAQKSGCALGEMNGYMGYWGMWYEGERSDDDDCHLEDGDIIERRDLRAGENGSSYEIMQSKGKLSRHTVKTLALGSLHGIDFEMNQLPGDNNNFGSFNPGSDPYSALRDLRQNPDHHVNNWLVSYLTTISDGVLSNGFYIRGYKTYGSNGPELTLLSDITNPNNLADTYNVSPSRFEGEQLWMFSQQLGGEVRYTKDASTITYNMRETVDPNDAVFGLNGSSDVALNCLFQCPKGNLSEGDLNSFGGPYESFDHNSNNLETISYTMQPGSMMLKNASNTAVALEDGVQSSGQYMWGVQSGPMVTASVLAGLDNWWDVFNQAGTVFYTWETGSNSFNQAIFAKSVTSGEYASFDKPIEFSYAHSTAKDRLDDDTFDGKTYLLGYGGKCNLWGIPSAHVGGSNRGKDRWYPSFGIKDGTLLGANHQYILKALEGEQLPKTTPGQCGGLNIEDPSIPLPDSPGPLPSHYLSEAPDIAGEAPLVIGGEVQE